MNNDSDLINYTEALLKGSFLRPSQNKNLTCLDVFLGSTSTKIACAKFQPVLKGAQW